MDDVVLGWWPASASTMAGLERGTPSTGSPGIAGATRATTALTAPEPARRRGLAVGRVSLVVWPAGPIVTVAGGVSHGSAGGNEDDGHPRPVAGGEASVTAACIASQ